jgi:hypothetical protein
VNARQVAVVAAVDAVRVGHPDLDLDLVGGGQTERAQPAVGTGTPPGAVDDQVRFERLAGVEPDAGDHAGVAGQRGHRDLVADRHLGQRRDPAPDQFLEPGPADRDQLVPGRRI